MVSAGTVQGDLSVPAAADDHEPAADSHPDPDRHLSEQTHRETHHAPVRRQPADRRRRAGCDRAAERRGRTGPPGPVVLPYVPAAEGTDRQNI